MYMNSRTGAVTMNRIYEFRRTGITSNESHMPHLTAWTLSCVITFPFDLLTLKWYIKFSVAVHVINEYMMMMMIMMYLHNQI